MSCGMCKLKTGGCPNTAFTKTEKLSDANYRAKKSQLWTHSDKQRRSDSTLSGSGMRKL